MGWLWSIAIVGALTAIGRSIEARFGAKRGAHEIKEVMRGQYEPEPCYVEVRAQDYKHLALDFYDAVEQQAATRGFRRLADYDPNLAGALARYFHPTFVRTLTDDRGTIISIYNARMRGWLSLLAWSMRDVRAHDVGSELSDGTFLTVSNAWDARHVKLPAEVDTLHLPKATTLAALLDRHAARVAERLQRQPELQLLPLRTFEEMTASALRMHRLKADFQRKRGYQFTREELRDMAVNETTLKSADDLADVYEGLPPKEPELPPLSTIVFRLALWFLLVIAFFVGYRLLQISQH